jgi:hypothetical protein
MTTKQYQDVLAALQRKAPLAEIRDLLRSLKRSSTDINAGINEVDEFGLTICMRAAAHGRVRVVKAACEHGASIEKRRVSGFSFQRSVAGETYAAGD